MTRTDRTNPARQGRLARPSKPAGPPAAGRRERPLRWSEPGPLSDLLAPYAALVERLLSRWLVGPAVPPRLAEAMRYCAMDGGKRFRPALALMTAEAVGGGRAGEPAERAAVAVELVHCYSLVHDDLPAMDNDSIRRGRPTAHVKFGEAMAILVGDALLTRAFEVLAEGPSPLSARLIAELARGAGPEGMVAGQVADMDLCELPPGQAGLDYIHIHKTAALIRAAGRMGAICGGADEVQLAAVSDYAESLGLAFQLADDILDVTGRAESLGKTPGKDQASGKRTHVAELGPQGASQLAQGLTARATRAISPLGPAAGKLMDLAELLVGRGR